MNEDSKVIAKFDLVVAQKGEGFVITDNSENIDPKAMIVCMAAHLHSLAEQGGEDLDKVLDCVCRVARNISKGENDYEFGV